MADSAAIRARIEAGWNRYLSDHARLYGSESMQGSCPPSVFVGSYGYPRLRVGPMLPPVHGDTSIYDWPEAWRDLSLDDIVGLRLGMVRGVRTVRADAPGGRYIADLQEMAMARRPADSDIEFEGAPEPVGGIDARCGPFGPAGQIRQARFSATAPDRRIERMYYDRDASARQAVMDLYGRGLEVSQIHRCLSAAMLGVHRRLVPTRWAITASDSIISSELIAELVEYDLLDRYLVFSHSHLGNSYHIILYPHGWAYELIEAWHDGDSVGFGADYEDRRHKVLHPRTAGAFYAARLGVAEYLHGAGRQSGAIVLREIYPEYAVPVGVWQVRQGIRAAMQQAPQEADSLRGALELACRSGTIGSLEWRARGASFGMAAQTSIVDYV